MKSFLVKNKLPLSKWSQLKNESYFEGEVPEGYSLAINPSDNYIIIDIDNHNDIQGIKNIPLLLVNELLNYHFKYNTKNNGVHIWVKYTGQKNLINKSSSLGIDLRTSKGYVVWYLDKDIRPYKHLIKDTSSELNIWIESLFS